jgi:hemerythrin-like domain-containing protein
VIRNNQPDSDDHLEEAPLESFSHCHEGIIAHLGALDELPALVVAANQAQEQAGRARDFFAEAMLAHHEEEERELFTAVVASAQPGEESERVMGMVERLTHEHREIEAMWRHLEPQLKRLANGHIAPIDTACVEKLVRAYKGHAAYEEGVFLPLCQTILGRNGSHMAALGLSLHMRHAKPKLPYI